MARLEAKAKSAADSAGGTKKRVAPPAHLSERGLVVWKQTAPGLLNLGVLQVTDRDALVRYCELEAQWRELNRDVVENGTVEFIHTKHGGFEKERPQHSQLLKVTAELNRLAAQFGLNPAMRARLRVQAPPTEADPKEAARREKKLSIINGGGL